MTSTSTPNYTRTDLRTLADRARDVQLSTTDDTLRDQAEAVEAVLRCLVGDAPGDALTAAVTAGGIPDPVQDRIHCRWCGVEIKRNVQFDMWLEVDGNGACNELDMAHRP